MKDLAEVAELGEDRIKSLQEEIDANMDEVDEWWNIDQELTRQAKEEKIRKFKQ